jgi:uncharacterized protein
MTRDLTFPSHGVDCAAWHVSAQSDALTTRSGRPCVVMAHGFGGTRDSGLLTYAEAFAAAGIDALVFDYRGFGDSHGTPRQHISVKCQRQDFHAALAAARHLPGVDTDRIALWGYSYGGGHVIAVAAQDHRVAAVVTMSPATDGLATLTEIVRRGGARQLALLAGHGLRDLAQAVMKQSPHSLPIVGPPGSAAMITVPGAEDAYRAMAGPTARNEVRARHALTVAMNRPTTFAHRLTCPLLVQIGTADDVVPVQAARRAARRAGHRAHLRAHPFDHFGGFQHPWQHDVIREQVEFLTRVLEPSRLHSIRLR